VNTLFLIFRRCCCLSPWWLMGWLRSSLLLLRAPLASGLLLLFGVGPLHGAEYDVPPPPAMAAQPPSLIEPRGPLTLTDALALSLQHNPALNRFAWSVRAGEVRMLRAGLRPNPELGIEVENFGGSGATAFEDVESTLSISQLIELGGKRMRRRDLATTKRDLASWDYEAQRLDLLSATQTLFVAVLTEQARSTMATESSELAEAIYQTVVDRVEAGKISPLEQSKSRVELAKTGLVKVRAERQLVAARQRLAALWGSVTPLFKKAAGDLTEVREPPALPTLMTRVTDNPDVARWAAQMSLSRRAIALAEARTIPDLTVTAGLRHFSTNNDLAGVVGLSVPLYIFDNKQTGVEEAEIGLTQALYKRKSAEVAVRSELIEAYQRLQMAWVEINAVRNELMPSAEAALVAANEAFRSGKIGSLDLLDAQRTLFEVRRTRIEALALYHLTSASIERLVGGSLHDKTTREQP
jgi:cobalt-zinc-cadmium efflux system outer membrane protein